MIIRSLVRLSPHRHRLSTQRANSQRTMSTAATAAIPTFSTLKALREWRARAFAQNESVGFVATMGALHEGHMALVRRSLAENDLTICSIFVNPAQFAPHEDLASYPRTLPADLAALAAQEVAGRTLAAAFVPNALEMYPSGISQDPALQRGTFVEVMGYGQEMEGRSRPIFFRGVATVVTKLFNAVQPTRTYFGQKDIQQALLLRRMCKDLLMTLPYPENLHIVPTVRDSTDGLALSSRNAYLSASARRAAVVMPSALTAAQDAWNAGKTKDECVRRAEEVVSEAADRARADGAAEIRLDYVQLNDADTFFEVPGHKTQDTWAQQSPHPVILSAAIWVDKTRLIDNYILGDVDSIIF
ncbi:Pantoate-beta-alanine ligase [Schizophyllum fasciatum]